MTSRAAIEPAAAFLAGAHGRAQSAGRGPQLFRAATDWEALTALGWIEDEDAVEIDFAHPCVPVALCRRPGCDSDCQRSRLLCDRCRVSYLEWRRDRGLAADEGAVLGSTEDPQAVEFVQVAKPKAVRHLRYGVLPTEWCAVCRVPGHFNPAVKSAYGMRLCAIHHDRWLKAGGKLRSSAADVRRWAGEQAPIPHDGTVCERPGCRWPNASGTSLCHPHHQRELHARRSGSPGADARSWLPLDLRTGRLVVRGLPEPLRSEYLWWMSHRARRGLAVRPRVQNRLLTVLYEESRAGLSSARDLEPALLVNADRAEKTVRYGLSQLAREATLHALTVEEVYDLDVWAMSKLRPGLEYEVYVSFEGFTQQWLKDLAKWYARVDPRQLEPKNLRTYVQALALFGSTLQQRDDGGADPTILRRADVERLLRHVRRQVADDVISAKVAEAVVARLRVLLLEARERDAPPVRVLHHTVSVFKGDVPRNVPSVADDDLPGRAFPERVLQTLLAPAALSRLSRPQKMLMEILAETGRRPQEVTRANPASCLQWDEIVEESSGQRVASPVFVHDMPKVRKKGFRLPITEQLAARISEYVAWLGEQYPGTPLTQLALVPADYHNAYGNKPLGTTPAGRAFRSWTGAMAADGTPFLMDDGVTAFPWNDLTLYGFRHSYAQRHVDAGTPIHTLKDLMGHVEFKSTQAYYSVRMQERRAATQRLAQMRVDQGGRSITLTGDADSVVVRQQVGELPVPYGYCTEPSNVKTHGRACPHRYVCTGCSYFRTDPSHLPELQRYRTQLVTQRDLLASPVDDLADWARPSARPSEEEIAAVERLITALEERVAAAPDAERGQLRAAIETAAAARRQLRGATLPGIVGQPLPLLFPEPT